jgi:hypothetical protein
MKTWTLHPDGTYEEITPMLEDLQILRNFDADGTDSDALVALYASGKSIREAYAEHGLDIPSWLTESLRAVKREIGERQRDFKARELKMLRAKIESKKAESLTVDDLEKRAAALESELGE